VMVCADDVNHRNDISTYPGRAVAAEISGNVAVSLPERRDLFIAQRYLTTLLRSGVV
jgi:hypothetical protein